MAEDLMLSVADVFETSQEKQEECKNGLLFLERLAASGFELPAQIIIDFLWPADSTECTWILTTAVALGLGNVTRLMTEAGASVKLQNEDSPFHIAVNNSLVIAVKNKSGLVRALVESDLVSPNEPDGDYEMPLNLAAWHGSAGSLRVLLQCGATVNSPPEDDSALHICAGRGNQECLQLLMEHGAQLDGENERGLTPLMKSVEGEHIECVRLLLIAGANVKEKNRGAAHIAALRNCTEILKVLIDAGAPLEGVFTSEHITTSMTPLHVASSAHALDSLRLLIALGADVNARTEDGATPLHLSVVARRAQWGRLLDVPNEEETRWKQIVRYGKFQPMQHDCIRALLDAGANIRSVCSEGQTVLHYAARDPSPIPETLKILLEAGVPVNFKDKKGRMALQNFITTA